jgi:predicted permease
MLLTRSFRHAARRLAHARGFSLAAILTLALGLGATATVFAVMYSVLLRPLPYPEPDRLVSLSHTLVVNGALQVNQTDASILFFRRHTRALTQLGGYQPAAVALGPVGGTDAEHVLAGRVTADLLPALRVSPLQGRLFTDSDDLPGAASVVLIGAQLWDRKFGGNAGILNGRLEIDGVAHEVVGILPANVRFPSPDTELWLPMRLDPARTDSASFDYQAIGRLREGVSIDEAAAELQRWLPLLPDEFPGRLTRASIDQTHMRVSLRPLAAVMVGDIGRVLWILLGAAGFVLAIACSNVANLFFVRAERRSNGIAIQKALGASTRVVIIELLCEGFLIAAFAGALAIVIAGAGIQILRLVGDAAAIPRLAELRIDGVVVLVTGLSTLFAALFINGLPAVRVGTSFSSSNLRPYGGWATISRDQHRMRNALVVIQVGFALVLLVSSGLLARSLWRLKAIQPGFESTGAITFRLALPAATYPGTDEPVRLVMRALDGIARAPGVKDAAVASKLPLDDQGRADSAVFVEDRPMSVGSLPGIHPVVYVTPAYFSAAGIPLIEGRTFSRPDPPHVSLEAIVSRAFAERYWKTESPIGKRIRILTNGPWYSVAGVVGDVRDTALDRSADQIVYCPLLPAREDRRWAPRDLVFVVRTMGDPAAVTAEARAVIRTLDPSLPVYRVRPLTDLVRNASARRSFTFLLVACASGIALLLGTIGLYGVMSYVVTLRTREMGLRLALGAQPRAVRRMVCRQGLSVALRGIALGLAGAIVLTRSLAALLFEVSTTDPLVLVLSAAFLLLVAAAAAWFPAQRAAAIDPAIALKAE